MEETGLSTDLPRSGLSEVRLSGRRSGYSAAAVGGGLIALAGQTADSSVIAGDEGLAAEFDSALAALVAALEEAGGAPGDLLQVRIFVIDVAAYVAARPAIGDSYKRRLEGHYPTSTLVEVNGLLGGAAVELEGLAVTPAATAPAPAAGGEEYEAVIRLRLAPADARYFPRTAAGSKAMEIFADLETELALHEGGDEGLCAAYDMVEFLAPLRAGDFVEGRARVVSRGRTSRQVAAEIYKVVAVDGDGVVEAQDGPLLAARASATIVVATTKRELAS
jgi:enamine deaminase RidA (YjgF/YER057c/UK114 family)/acyl-CoA hydrolase